MPTNLPPEYFEAERIYKAAKTPKEKIAALEDLISTIPKHKGTDKLRADFRKRLSKLKSKAQPRKKSKGQKSPYQFDREGAGLVVILGHTNVGKSALVNALTNASPEISAVPYTTWNPTPGMMLFENVQIQLVDTPPLNKEFVDPELVTLIRRADMVLLMVDIQTYPLEQVKEMLDILEEHRIFPLHMKEKVKKTRRMIFMPTLLVANKCDDEDCDEVFQVFCELLEGAFQVQPVSILAEKYLDELKKAIYELLNVIRVYAKPPGEDPDYSAPFVLRSGSTVEDFAGKVHKDFLRDLKYARIWGSGTFDGQMVGRDHILHEGDVVELKV